VVETFKLFINLTNRFINT